MPSRALHVLATVLATALATFTDAAPFEPASDDEVLERIPVSVLARAGELQTLRRRVAAEPTNAALAAELARRYIEIARAESDPRFLGYAQATLAPWSTQALPPSAEMRVLGAIVKQQRHDFDGALDELEAVLALDSRNAQAWLTSASILQTKGEQQQALAQCTSLSFLPDGNVLGAICTAKSLALMGRSAQADGVLRAVLDADSTATSIERRWALTVRAEMLARLGRLDEADRCFAEALSLGAHDTYLLTAYADLLLDANAPARVRELLESDDRVDALLLRTTLAEMQLAVPVAPRIAALKARFAVSREREDAVHLRDEAIFTLHVLGEAEPALAVATQNWARQREPRDARILLEAALASNDARAAAPVVDYLDRTHLEDVRLAALVETLPNR